MMKRLAVLAFFLITFIALSAAETAGSMPFADSFLLRAKGAEALYWNPALISENYQDVILPGMNVLFRADNNAYDLDTYNYISGRYLNETDKTNLLNKVGDNLKGDARTDIMLLGLTLGRVAFASSVHAKGDFRLSHEYLELLLMGNEDQDYIFEQKENQLRAISYQDVTIGFGNVAISPVIGNIAIPTATLGASVSALLGYGIAETEEYTGSLHSGLDGMSLNQDVYLKTGIGGLGMKAMVGLKTTPLANLSLGLSLDNLLGQIRWMGKKDRYHYLVKSDSAYVSNLDENFITTEESSVNLPNFTTAIPPELRLGGIYRYRKLNVSVDWTQGFASSQLTSAIGKFSLAAEYKPIPTVSFIAGWKPGNLESPVSYSYGFGFKGINLDGSFGCESFDSALPGYKSRGIAFSSSLKIHY